MCFSKDAIVDVEMRNYNTTIPKWPITGILFNPKYSYDVLMDPKLHYISSVHYGGVPFTHIDTRIKTYTDIYVDKLLKAANSDSTKGRVIFYLDEDVLKELDNRGIYYSILIPRDIDVFISTLPDSHKNNLNLEEYESRIRRLIRRSKRYKASLIMYSDYPPSRVFWPCAKWNIIQY